MFWFLTGLAILAVVIVLFFVLKGPALKQREEHLLKQAMDQFRIRREQLEAKFYDIASNLGKPRGVTWNTCDWKPPVEFARDNESGLLTAFVSVEISFAAIPGGDMEDVEAVGDLRDASALFHYQNGNWGTGGKALFNMDPKTAVQHLQGQFTPIASSSPEKVGQAPA